MHGAVIKS